MAQSTLNKPEQDDEQIDAFSEELDKLPVTEPERSVPVSFRKNGYSQAGNQDSKPLDKGGLKSTEEDGGSFKYRPNGSTAGGASSGGSSSTDDSPMNYRRTAGAQNIAGAQSGGGFKVKDLLSTRRRKVIGGTLGGSIAGGSIVLFTIFSGPLQFIHFSQLLQQFHFAGTSSTQDSRFMHEVRWLRYASKGEAQKARMGYLGNKFTNTFEGRLKTVGLTPQYDKTLGNFIGYEVDTTSKESPYHGLKPDEAKAVAARDFGVDVSSYNGDRNRALKGVPMIETATGTKGFFTNLKFDNKVLKGTGLNGIASAIGSHAMCQRRGCSLHPIKQLVIKTQNKATAKAEEKKKWQTDRELFVEGEKPPLDPLTTKEQDPNKAGAAGANEAASSANQTVQEAQAKGADPVAEGKKISAKAKVGGGAIFAIGIACTLREIDKKSGEIKDAQVVAPAIRMGMEQIALGEQVKSNKDIDTTTLSFYSDSLSGIDSRGKKSSWVDAQSIQANLGNPGVGVPPSSTLTSATTTEKPFHVLEDGTLGTLLGTACGGAVGLALTALSFAGGLTEIIQAGIQSVIIGQVSDQAAHWLAGKALPATNIGADLGSTADFGSWLAANDQSTGLGGRPLTKDENKQLVDAVNGLQAQNFNQQSIAHRLFSPSDESSVFAKFIDKGKPTLSQNLASLSSSFLNFGHIFSAFPNIFSAHASAGSVTPYDYGADTNGFSAGELSDPRLENPFENACYVTGCPDKNIGGFLKDGDVSNTNPYIKKAQDCSGVNVEQVSVLDTNTGTQQKEWNVTSGSKSPSYEDLKKFNCSDTSDFNWTRMRFFILDTQTMNSMACYAGDSSNQDSTQACADSNVSSGSSVPTSTATASTAPVAAASGDAKTLAAEILSNTKITASSPDITQDLQAAANGKPGTAGAMTSTAILKLIATIGRTHSVAITAIQSNGVGHCNKKPKASCPNDPHYTGDGVDFGNLDGTHLTGRDSASVKIINIAEAILPPGPTFGQQACGPKVDFASGFTDFTDSCDHLHIQVPQGTP